MDNTAIKCIEYNKIFKSFSAAEREYNLPKGKISKTIKKSGLNFIINNLEITILD